MYKILSSNRLILLVSFSLFVLKIFRLVRQTDKKEGGSGGRNFCPLASPPKADNGVGKRFRRACEATILKNAKIENLRREFNLLICAEQSEAAKPSGNSFESHLLRYSKTEIRSLFYFSTYFLCLNMV